MIRGKTHEFEFEFWDFSLLILMSSATVVGERFSAEIRSPPVPPVNLNRVNVYGAWPWAPLRCVLYKTPNVSTRATVGGVMVILER